MSEHKHVYNACIGENFLLMPNPHSILLHIVQKYFVSHFPPFCRSNITITGTSVLIPRMNFRPVIMAIQTEVFTKDLFRYNNLLFIFQIFLTNRTVESFKIINIFYFHLLPLLLFVYNIEKIGHFVNTRLSPSL